MRRTSRLLGLALALLALLSVSACAAGVAGGAPSVQVSAQTPTATPPPPTPTQDPWLTKALTVRGTQITLPDGKPITLLGAARYSLEFECQGDGHFQLADFQAMRAWGMNTVRFPLSSAFWRNLDNKCPTYQTTVARAVDNAEAAGLYVILDLQRDAPFSYAQDATVGGAQCPLPDATYDVAFWKSVATTYRNDPRVLFDIFGEPYDISWYQWWNGGPITSSCYGYSQAATYLAISMPALGIAVRAIAPRNVIILSGLAWGYDLSDITPHHAAPISNILYGTHPWDHGSVQGPGDWQRAFGNTAQSLPVIATEFGAYNCQTGYISTELDYFTRLHISYLAWAWTPGACQIPGLIINWSGAPTVPYGQYIRQRMLQASATNP